MTGAMPIGMGPDTPYLDDYNDEALAWAEKNLERADEFDRPWLTSYLIEGYSERGMHDRMMNVAWNNFLSDPGPDSIERLRDAANEIGQWPQWLERIKTLLRDTAKGTYGDKIEPATIGSLLASVMLDEDDDEGAWQAAMEFGAIPPVWLDIADARARNNPADAIAIYRAEIERELESSYNYDLVGEMLTALQKIMVEADQGPEFDRYIDELRTTWTRRKKFIAMLDEYFNAGTLRH
jgi:hypothetical protein